MADTLIENKKARLNFEIVEEMEAGIELLGHEVKSIKGRQGSLEGAYVTIRGGEAFLMGAFIPPYQAKNTPESYDPYRVRRLLLTKSEIARLADIENQKGLTIVAISMYNKNRKVKVRSAIVRGKKKHDKRETIKKRDANRDIRRTLKYE
jgi:SsrA-binding protein